MNFFQELFGQGTKSKAALPRSQTLRVGTVELYLQRKAVRTLRIGFSRDGLLCATAPLSLSDAAILEFVASKQVWIQRQRLRLQDQLERAKLEDAEFAGLDAKAKRALLRQQSRQLHVAALALLPRWESALGVKVSAIGIRAMRSRWGSCNTRTHKITLGLALTKHPPDCLEYILVHEMCHLLVREHSAKFKALMDKHLPHWKSLQKRLDGQEKLF